MKLEDQVTPLTEAIRLKELGIKQESIWSWYVTTDRDDTPSLNRSGYHCPTCGHPRAPYFAEVAAFTVAELGEMTPDYLTIDAYRMHFHSYKQEQFRAHALWTCTFGMSLDEDVPEFYFHSEAQARAALLIHLLESKLITAEEVNARL